jgi:hypothetical protein
MGHIYLRCWIDAEIVIGILYFVSLGLFLVRVRIVGRSTLGRWHNLRLYSLHPLDITKTLIFIFIGRSEDFIVMNLIRIIRALLLSYVIIFAWLWFSIATK